MCLCVCCMFYLLCSGGGVPKSRRWPAKMATLGNKAAIKFDGSSYRKGVPYVRAADEAPGRMKDGARTGISVLPR
ncbi:hypothetical protein F5Y13DRAFT_164112 [Hypoxylon sp. FL1857]|nr:hypothetical protein F5Y13DRAFT_164112 [Hypoxylon sp. FL1857]